MKLTTWQVHVGAFHIGTEHLFGSNSHACVWQKGESKELLWEPKTDYAKLNVMLGRGKPDSERGMKDIVLLTLPCFPLPAGCTRT